jgi:hypothetical protein
MWSKQQVWLQPVRRNILLDLLAHLVESEGKKRKNNITVLISRQLRVF